MGYASRQGRARISPRSPEAAGVCDRCGFIYTHSTLRWQFDYAGAGLINKRILVCASCYDTPQAQLRAIVLPPDPQPIMNPRPPNYVTAQTTYRTTSGQNTTNAVTGLPVLGTKIRSTQDNNTRVIQQTGEPPGGNNTTPGISSIVPGSSNPGLPYNNTTVPKTGNLV